MDSTALPNANATLVGVKVRSHFDGTFTVLTMDRSLAPATGVPFNYVVFNVSDAGSYHVRSRAFGGLQ